MPTSTRSGLGRRAVLGAGAAALAAAAIGWVAWPRARFDGNALAVSDAHAAAAEGRIVLVDIRRPEEWARTGIGEGAHPIDMRRPDFLEALGAIAGPDKDAPIALICAQGVRSAHVANAMTEAGYTNVIDVPEGMLGSAAGPGWIGAGLPVRAYSP